MTTLSYSSRCSPRWLRPLLYEDEYLWLALLAVVQVQLGWLVARMETPHVQSVYLDVVREMGFLGALLIQMLSVALAVILAEDIGRRRPATGRAIAWAAISFSFLPIFADVFVLLSPRV